MAGVVDSDGPQPGPAQARMPDSRPLQLRSSNLEDEFAGRAAADVPSARSCKSAGRSIQRVPAFVLGAVNSPVSPKRCRRMTMRPEAPVYSPSVDIRAIQLAEPHSSHEQEAYGTAVLRSEPLQSNFSISIGIRMF